MELKITCNVTNNKTITLHNSTWQQQL